MGMLQLASCCDVFQKAGACCFATSVVMTKQQPTCGRWLYKSIFETNDEGVNEPAQYAYLPQHTFGLLWTAQHIWYPFDSNLSSSTLLLPVDVCVEVGQGQRWILIP